MRDLVEAACGTQNPLVRLSQQVRGDVARQQDGLGAGASAAVSGPSRQAPGTFHMGSLLHEMRTVDQGANQWASEFQPAQTLHSNWDNEFLQGSSKQIPRLANSTVSPQPVAPQQLYGHPSPYMHSIERFRPPMAQNTTVGAASRKWAEDILTESELRAADEKTNLIKVAKEYVQAEDSANVKQTDFYKFVENVAHEKQQQANTPGKTSTTGDGVSKDDTQFWHDLSSKWNDSAVLKTREQWAQSRDILPESYRSYRFNEQTPIDESVVQNPFQEGLNKLKQGDLPSAVLLFEAAVKKDSAHVEAWQYLGTTQAQNEQDVQAIAALRKCIALDPRNLVALMSLGVSYYNEGLQRQAYEALREWLRANPKYSHLVPGAEPQMDQGVNITTMEKKAHEEITDLYIRAAQIHPENPDADVQSGLGVLLNMSFEFDKAIDCFKAAVSVRPDDAGSWNRLGATLANSGRSAEAVEAYRHALQLYPGYIRARFNLGISCINMSCYNEAAEHFISALNLQNNAKADQYALSRSTAMSDNIWNTLRMSITLMNRSELYKVVEARDLEQLSRIFLKT